MRELLFRGQTRRYGEKVKPDGSKIPGSRAYARATFPRFLVPCYLGPDFAFLDVNNCGEECISWLLKYGFGELLGRVETSGFCRYPEFRFSEQKLREIDAEAYETHIQNWKAYHHTTWPRSSECTTDADGQKN